MSPIEFFAAHQADLKKVDALVVEADRLSWERERCSGISPGPVRDDETLCRQVVNPVHVEKDGSLKPTAFDDCMNKGMSVDREAHSDEGAVIARGLARARDTNERNLGSGRDPHDLHAIARFVAGNVRAHRFDGAQSLGVYDTALEDNISHADICMIIPRTTHSKRSVRAHLFELAEANTKILKAL